MDEETQRKVIEFSSIEQENRQLEQQLQAIEQQIGVFQILKSDIEEMGKHEGELLSSIGSGIFMKSKLLDNKKVLINVGSGIVVEKTIDEAKKVIDNQISKVEEAKHDVKNYVEKNFELMVNLETELRKLIEKKE